MKVVVQRAKEANVTVEGEVVGEISKGFMLLVGVTHEDEMKDADYLADKIVNLRVFEDETGKMNHHCSILKVKFYLFRSLRYMVIVEKEDAQILWERQSQTKRLRCIIILTSS